MRKYFLGACSHNSTALVFVQCSHTSTVFVQVWEHPETRESKHHLLELTLACSLSRTQGVASGVRLSALDGAHNRNSAARHRRQQLPWRRFVAVCRAKGPCGAHGWLHILTCCSGSAYYLRVSAWAQAFVCIGIFVYDGVQQVSAVVCLFCFILIMKQMY
jgi:hypothetical protein